MREGGNKAHEKLKPSGTKRKSLTPAGVGDPELRNAPEGENAGRASGDRVRSLRHILTRIGSEKNLGKSLDRLLAAVTEELGGHSAALWVLDPKDGNYILYGTSFEGNILEDAQQLGHPYAAKRGRFKKKVIARALAHGLFTIPDVGKSRFVEPKVAQWMMSQGIKSLLCVPLIVGGDAMGVLTIRGTSLHAFGPDSEQLAQLLAHPIGLAVHLMQLARKAEESAVLEERTRIAREIHDSLAQILVEIITRLEHTKQDLPSEMDFDRRAQLDYVQCLAREALTEAQRTVRALSPAQVERQGLLDALRELAVARRGDVQMEFSLLGEPHPLQQETENDIFRIGQEAINNALRHAKAQKVRIELAYEADRVKLTVEDDGRGFDPERADQGGGFGLTSLRQRVERAGGQLAIQAEVNRGTRVVAEFFGTHGMAKKEGA